MHLILESVALHDHRRRRRSPSTYCTDYTYNAATGTVASVTAPAPSAGAARPRTRYTFTSVGGVSLLAGVSTCIAGSSCAGTANEVKTTIAYNANLLPTTITKAAGDGSVSAGVTIGHDAVGNRVTVDGPLAGNADTTTLRYDALRRPTGVISADPDGSGSLERRARRTSYDAAGRLTEVEIGTVAGTSDAAWAAFVSKQQVTSSYELCKRKVGFTRRRGDRGEEGARGSPFASPRLRVKHDRREGVCCRFAGDALWARASMAMAVEMCGSSGSRPGRLDR